MLGKILALSLLLASPGLASAAPREGPFHPGEKTTFAITYFGATAGILDLEVLPLSLEKGKAKVELAARARTDSIFSFFYKFRNLYRSTLDPESGLSSRFIITHDETKLGGTVTVDFDQRGKKITYSDRREDRKSGAKIEKTFTRTVPEGTRDVVAAFFHLRTLPLEVGKSFDFPVLIGEELHHLRVSVEKEEDLPTKIGEIPSWVLRPSLLKNGIVEEIAETFVWIARDKTRAMVKIKAKVKLGSIVAYLARFEPGKPAKAHQPVSRGVD